HAHQLYLHSFPTRRSSDLLEIDVGLHRGGFQPGEAFIAALEKISRSPWLSLSGLMGYEAHIGKIPALLGGPDAALNATRQRYAADRKSTRLNSSHVKISYA